MGATGAGFANYSAVHEQAARERYRRQGPGRGNPHSFWVRARNPHNEYVMQLVGGGDRVAGAVPRLARPDVPAGGARAPAGQRPLAGMGLAFAVGCLFNSLLMDFVEGHLYIALLAWLLAENRYPRA